VEEAGFVDITVKEYKVPVGDWPEDEGLKTVGHAAMKAYTTDIEGMCPLHPVTACGH
jgi:hypothetical protein